MSLGGWDVRSKEDHVFGKEDVDDDILIYPVLRNRAILPRFRFRVSNFFPTVPVPVPAPVPTLKF